MSRKRENLRAEFVVLWEDRTWDTVVCDIPDYKAKDTEDAIEEWFRHKEFNSPKYKKAVNFYFWSILEANDWDDEDWDERSDSSERY